MKLLIPCILALPVVFGPQTNKPEVIVLETEHVENAYPRLSADCKEILFQTNRNKNWQICIAKLDQDGKVSENGTVIGPDSCNNNFPDWSPDNDWVAFVSDRFGNEEICIMKRDGSGFRRLTDHAARDIHPYFSPDGKSLLFNSDRNGSFDIFQIDLSSGVTKLVSGHRDDETCARFTPDMKKIVCLRNSGTSDDIFEMDLASGTWKNITGDPGVRDGWPMYSQEGAWIYYSSMRDGPFCVFRIKTDGTSREKLTSAGRGEEHARVFVARDGKSFIYNLKSGTTISVRRISL